MREAVIVDAVRTPLGRGKQTGALHGWHPVDLAAHTLKAIQPALSRLRLGGRVFSPGRSLETSNNPPPCSPRLA